MDIGSTPVVSCASPSREAIRELDSDEWVAMMPVESLLMVRWELERRDKRPARASCGHDRSDICQPLFGEDLYRRLRTAFAQVERLVPFPSLSAPPPGSSKDGQVGLKGLIRIFERAIVRIPDARQLQAEVTRRHRGCEPIHAKEEAARALRLKSGCEVLVACLRSLDPAAKPFLPPSSGSRHRWEEALRASYPGSRT